MAVLRFSRQVQEFNAGFDFCETCARSRRHMLRVSFWRLEVAHRPVDLWRRYTQLCTECGRSVKLGQQPDMEEVAARAAEEEIAASRSESYMELARRMEYLLSPIGVDARKAILDRAAAVLHGLLLEYARMQGHDLTKNLLQAWAPASARPAATPPPPAELERLLEGAMFQAATNGYLLHHVAAARQPQPAAAPAARSEPPGPGDYVRIIGPRATGRAERGRSGADPDVAAWIWEAGEGMIGWLADRGPGIPARLHSQVAAAARACLYFGHAVGVEERLAGR